MAAKKGTFSEEDVCSLLQRYPAATILTVLREISQCPTVDIDWDLLLTKTTSGITSAKELQLLWRHLAYRHPLNVDPHDDDTDSDLDFEVDPFPPLSCNASFEAASCVKVLAAGTSTECGMTSNATNDLEMPNAHACNNPSAPSLLPASNVPQLAPPQTEGVDPNGLVNPSRKKRKWTEEEDSKLLACVKNFGEGNWDVISKHAQLGRTTAQLSQRWTNMKRKQGSGNVGATTSTRPQLSESLLATNRAIDMALKDNVTAVVGNGAADGTNNPSKIKTKLTPTPTPTPTPTLTPTPMPVPSVEPRGSSMIGLAQRQAGVTGRSDGFKKGVPRPKPPSINLERTAVAVGARIGSPSVAADALRNCATVRFFRSSTSVSFPANGGQVEANKDTPVKPSLPKVARNTSAPSSKKNLEAKVPCPDPKLKVRVPDNLASLPQSLPPSPAVTKQTPALGNIECANATNGNSVNQGKDETPLSATQTNANATLESTVDAATKKLESPSQGLPEAK